MSTTNPPKTSGSSLEQAGRKQQNLPLLVAVFLLLHAVVLGGILWVGCKPHKEDIAKNEAPPPSPLGGLAPIGDTNTSPFFQPLDNSQSPAAPGSDPGPSGPPPGPVGPPPVPPSTGISSGPIAPPPSTPSPASPTGPTSVDPVMPPPAAPPPPPPPGSASVITPPAPAPSAPAPAPAPTGRTHTVGRGDTYYSIAREYKTTMNAIKAANRGVDPTKLQLGQKINIPAPARPTAARR
ncbi:MAG: LysM peptidoglycan-binding domain-containing protein [Limisphaerales bacterium]